MVSDLIVSVLDVVENVLGPEYGETSRIDAITEEEFDELAERVHQFYRDWEPPSSAEDEFRMYAGGWIAGNYESSYAFDYLKTSLVYANSVVVHNPLAAWFFPRRHLLIKLPRLRFGTV